MTDNTTRTEDGAELYLHDIYFYADEYIERERDGDKTAASEYFVDMILYISDRIPKPSHDDIDLLDNIFNIYIRLCSKYKVLPSLEIFSFLVKINRTTFTDWKKGEYRTSSAHAVTVKNWFEICKSFAINRLHNKGGTDANLIFIAKAAYGMVEAAPAPAANAHQGLIVLDHLPRLDDLDSEDVELLKRAGD